MSVEPTHLFFYWRADAGDIDAALAATRHWQQVLMAHEPSLLARLFVRRDVDSGCSTVMEAYVADEPGCVRLREEGDAATAGWRIGERHLERFADVS